MDELKSPHIPKEYSRAQLNKLYRDIPLQNRVYATLRKYFNAMANLYGIISLKKAYEIISAQCPAMVTKQQFIYFSEIARHECEDYKILSPHDLDVTHSPTPPLDWEIIDATLLDSGIEAYKETKFAHHGKSYYVPLKTRFLAYSDAFYCDETPETIAMHRVLVSACHMDKESVAEFFEELIYSARCLNVNLAQVLVRLKELGYSFYTEEDAQLFVSVYQAFHNDFRMQCHRGHTPNEMLSMGNSITPHNKSQKSQINSRKIGRNELCPCGSGKKYKNCCGR